MLAVDRDVKPRNMNFAKVEKTGGGGINREGAFIAINTVFPVRKVNTFNRQNKILLYGQYCNLLSLWASDIARELIIARL